MVPKQWGGVVFKPGKLDTIQTTDIKPGATSAAFACPGLLWTAFFLQAKVQLFLWILNLPWCSDLLAAFELMVCLRNCVLRVVRLKRHFFRRSLMWVWFKINPSGERRF